MSEELARERRAHAQQRGAVAELRARCASHAKERHALAAILDNKVLALLTHVAGLLHAPSNAAAAAGDGQDEVAATRTRAVHELGVLQRLVGASVAALRMPDAAPPALNDDAS